MTCWVFGGRAGSRAKFSRGTAAARCARKTVSHERGRSTAAARRQKKTVVHRPVLVGGSSGQVVMIGDGCLVPNPNPALRAGMIKFRNFMFDMVKNVGKSSHSAPRCRPNIAGQTLLAQLLQANIAGRKLALHYTSNY